MGIENENENENEKEKELTRSMHKRSSHRRDGGLRLGLGLG